MSAMRGIGTTVAWPAGVEPERRDTHQHLGQGRQGVSSQIVTGGAAPLPPIQISRFRLDGRRAAPRGVICELAVKTRHGPSGPESLPGARFRGRPRAPVREFPLADQVVPGLTISSFLVLAIRKMRVESRREPPRCN